MAFHKKKTMRVNTMYGADGRLRTAYFEGDAAAVAKKNVKAFNKELSKYEKAFADYASLDIESSKVNDLNTRFIFDKLNIAEKYVEYIPEDDMSVGLGDELTAIAGSRSAKKLGVGAKLASKFQPFFERQAEKHPRLRGLSDRITKAANDGRMPLTADSAAMMRIAFDKKYYNDCRRPDADREELRRQYDAAVENLTKMAVYDGVEKSDLSAKFSEKLIAQMQVDETLTDIYSGMADGSIRLADDKAVLNANGEKVIIGGRTLYERSASFVSSEKDAKGRNKPLDAWDFEPREPQTIEEILSDYQTKLDKYAQACTTEADFKRLLASDSFRNLERNAKAFAEADCPDDAAKFKYEFARTNIISCRDWALAHDNKSPYARMVVPPTWDEHTEGHDFVTNYAIGDYYSVDEQTEIYSEAVMDVATKTDDELAVDMADEYVSVVDKMSDTDKIIERLNALEEENKALREQISQMQSSSNVTVVEHESVDNKTLAPEHIPIESAKTEDVVVEASDVEIIDTTSDTKSNRSTREKIADAAVKASNIAGNVIGTAVMAKEAISTARSYGKKLIENIKSEYGGASGTILNAGDYSRPVEITAHEKPVLPAAETIVEAQNVADVVENKSDLSGRIEKYGLDIDFSKIDFVEIEKMCGESRMNDTMFYAAPDGSSVLMSKNYDDASRDIQDVPVDIVKAFEEITMSLDESTADPDTAVYIKPVGEEKRWVDAYAMKLRAIIETTAAENTNEDVAKETVSRDRFSGDIGHVDIKDVDVSAEPEYN